MSRRGLEEFFDDPGNWGEKSVKSGKLYLAFLIGIFEQKSDLFFFFIIGSIHSYIKLIFLCICTSIHLCVFVPVHFCCVYSVFMKANSNCAGRCFAVNLLLCSEVRVSQKRCALMISTMGEN